MAWLSVIGGFFASVFSNNRASDTAIDVIRNVTGANDLTDKDKLEFVLKHVEATKHQSQTRRFIAILCLLGFMLFTGSWLLASFVEHFYVFFMTNSESAKLASETHNIAKIKTAPMVSFKNEVYLMLKEVFKDPMSIIFGFYFLTQTISHFNKK